MAPGSRGITRPIVARPRPPRKAAISAASLLLLRFGSSLGRRSWLRDGLRIFGGRRSGRGGIGIGREFALHDVALAVALRLFDGQRVIAGHLRAVIALHFAFAHEA